MTNGMTRRLGFCAAAVLLIVVGLLHNRATAQQPASLPDQAGQVMLIRNTLAAVNHGNITGNYTVLRDLASERFRQRNTAADLGQTFGNLSQRKLDLSPILVIDPQLTQRPGTDRSGRFHLVGFFPTRPQAVQFALIFQPVNGGWMIDEVTMSVKPIESVVETQRPQSPPQAAERVAPRTAERWDGYRQPTQ